MSVTDEFPDFDYALPSIAGFVDSSWHNDVCPSLTRYHSDESRMLILWCDYADASLRELDCGKLFTLVAGGYGEILDQVTLCESDDLADIMAAIKAFDAAAISAIDLRTRVELYSGLIDWTEIYGPPEWRGTLGEFWHENEGAYHSFETFQRALATDGFIYLGGGAQPEFTLALDTPVRV